MVKMVDGDVGGIYAEHVRADVDVGLRHAPLVCSRLDCHSSCLGDLSLAGNGVGAPHIQII